MPGPFPGMDPYLEDSILWPEVHHRLITYTADALTSKTPPGYVARIEERVYVAQPGHSIYPDAVSRRPQVKRAAARSGSTAVAERADPPQILTLPMVEMTEGFIEIRSVAPPKRVVTVIEYLSPANKASGSIGRQKYLDKQSEVLQSTISLLEIDLLRQGAHTVAAPEDRLREFGAWDYLICLRRGQQPDTYEFWPIRVRERLPRVWVPLAAEHPDVVLDVQTVFDRCYDAGLYREDVDYRKDPPIPLEGDDVPWADALLRERGFRD